MITTRVGLPAQVSGGTNYWAPSDPYISALVPNTTPDSDLIAYSQATDKIGLLAPLLMGLVRRR